ncbi:hypothetical protein C0992_004256, partial [Termitomyces sp. T32_za158]
MIKLTFCFSALLLLKFTVAAPAPSSAASSAADTSAVSTVVPSSLPVASSTPDSATFSFSTSSLVPNPSATSIPLPTATVPAISLDPNEPLDGNLQPMRGSLGAPLLGPTDTEIVEQNPDALAPPTTDHGSIELHWHKTSEWAYILKGKTQVTSVDTMGRNFISTVGPGDLWFFPPGIPHSLQGTDDDPEGTEFLLVFDDGEFSEDSTFLVTDWLSHVPVE